MTGEPAHFELGVPDAARAKRFFGALLGWSFEATAGDFGLHHVDRSEL